MNRPIGIDLGTTYSAIACWKDTGMQTGPICYYFAQESQYYIASKLYIPDLSDKDNVMYGSIAIKRSISDPDKYYSAFKRGMDTNTVYDRPHGKITAVELSTLFLKYMMSEANKVEGVDFIPEGVVVSVPYYFLEPPKINTCEALSNALSEVYSDHLNYEDSINLKTVQEPIAAGLDYAFTNSDVLTNQNILVFDLGGGTFDVTIYEINNNLSAKKLVFTVLATDGDDRLGGEDFDKAIEDYVLEKNGLTQEQAYSQQNKYNLIELKQQITQTKCRLSSSPEDTIFVNENFVRETRITDKDISKILQGQKGYGKKDYISKIADIVDRCLGKSELKSSMIDRVVLVGGSSKIPCIRKLLESKFGKDKVFDSDRPSETVARGACIWAAYQLDLQNNENSDYHRHLHFWDEIIVKPKTAHNLGIVMANNVVDNLIASNVFTPVSSTRHYVPSSLNEDGTKAELKPLTIKQGNAIIGHIPVPTIYTHGRAKSDITISITLVAESTSVKVYINVPQGNEDRTDLLTEGQIEIL